MNIVMVESPDGFSIREGIREFYMLRRADGWDREKAQLFLDFAETAYDVGWWDGQRYD